MFVRVTHRGEDEKETQLEHDDGGTLTHIILNFSNFTVFKKREDEEEVVGEGEN